MLCKKFLRRRTAIKCLLLTIVGYMTYISMATFGKVDDIKEPDNSNGPELDYPILTNPIANSHLAEIKRLIDKHDNFKDYWNIKDNGALAKGMNIIDKNLSPQEKEKYDEGWQKYAFNNFVSTLIPMNRTLPDIRLPG